MLNKVPSIDELDRKFGFTTDGTTQNYILLGLPSPVSGPAFEKYGDSCIGAYVVHVFSTENIPYGPVCLAIWQDIDAFNQGLPANAFIEMSGLVLDPDTAEQKNLLHIARASLLFDVIWDITQSAINTEDKETMMRIVCATSHEDGWEQYCEADTEVKDWLMKIIRCTMERSKSQRPEPQKAEKLAALPKAITVLDEAIPLPGGDISDMCDYDHLPIAVAWRECRIALASIEYVRDRYDTLIRRWAAMTETIRSMIDAGTLTAEDKKLLNALKLPYRFGKRTAETVSDLGSKEGTSMENSL